MIILLMILVLWLVFGLQLTNYFRGDAQKVPQVTTFTVGGTVVAADTLTITINRKEITFTVTTETTTTEAAEALLALLVASTEPEFQEITWTSNANVITGTGRDDGKPYTVAASEVGNMTFSTSNTTVATGPYHWDNADNWSNGTVPVSGEDVVIDPIGNGVEMKIYWGIDQNAVNLNSLTINNAEIGLPDSSTYTEYLEKFLRIQTGNLTLGGTGQGLIRLDMVNGTTSGATAILVNSTPTSAIQDKPAVQIKYTHANTTLNAVKGSLGFAFNYGETANLLTARVGFVTSEQGDVSLFGGASLTLTTLNMSGGTVTLNAGLTTLSMTAGKAFVNAGNITTVNGDAGQFVYKAQGTLTLLNIGSDFEADLNTDIRAKTVTNCTLYKGGALKARGHVTFTNPIRLLGCELAEVVVDLGSNISIQRS